MTRTLWAKVASNLDRNPKIRAAGADAREVYSFLLRVNRDIDADGVVPLQYIHPDYLAEALMRPVTDVTHGLHRAIEHKLIALTENGVNICGWDDNWRPPKTGAERVQDHRARKRAQKTASNTQSNGRNVTGNGVTARREEKRREEIEESREKNKEPTLTRPLGGLVAEAVKRLRGIPRAPMTAGELHDVAEVALRDTGFAVAREVRVPDRGDGRPGKVDLVLDGRVAVEIDREQPRAKSIAKLQSFPGRIVLLRGPWHTHSMPGLDAVIGLDLPGDISSIPSQSISSVTREVVRRFNAAFGRQLSPAGWEKPVSKLLAKGYREKELLGVVWWAAEEWADDPEMQPKVSPTTLFKLQSSQGYRTFPEYLSCAAERWRETHDGAKPPWEEPEPPKLEVVQ